MSRTTTRPPSTAARGGSHSYKHISIGAVIYETHSYIKTANDKNQSGLERDSFNKRSYVNVDYLSETWRHNETAQLVSRKKVIKAAALRSCIYNTQNHDKFHLLLKSSTLKVSQMTEYYAAQRVLTMRDSVRLDT